ncbi:hypothetical protein MPSEU_000306300 [Mayamaea pseudoterrestris]|nr:hypothetical protein MPSEU_000306300 [Mayamaea pseudoterrestris]
MKASSTSTVLLLLLIDAASSFQSRPTFVYSSSSRCCSSSLSKAVSHRNYQQHQSTRLYNNAINLVDTALPTILFAGAIAYTVMKDEDFQIKFPNQFKSSLEQQSAPPPQPISVTVQQETDGNTVVTKQPATIAEAAVTPVAKVTSQQKPPAVATPVATKPSPAISVPVSKPVLTVVDVASTVEEQRATRELVEQKKKKQQQEQQGTKVANDATKSNTLAASSTSNTIAESANANAADSKASGKKRRMALRVLKKVVAPWRKWESIA